MTDRNDFREGVIPCSAVSALAFEYLDGEIPAERAASVDRHVERCPPCREHVERERAFLRALRDGMKDDKCPERVRERIREAMRLRRQVQ